MTTAIALIGLGNYKLLPQFSTALRDVDELHLLSCYSIDEMPEKINSVFQSKCSDLGDDNEENVPNCEEGIVANHCK